MSENKTNWVTTTCYDCGDWEEQSRLKEIEFKLYNSKGMSQAERNKLIAERDALIVKQKALHTQSNKTSNKNKLPLYIGLGIGALVIGYFAYRKLKK